MTIAWPTQDTNFVRWAAELRQTRPDIDINPIILDEEGWKAWGNQVNQSQVCQTAGAPRTDNFTDWRGWATEFIKVFGVRA